MRSTLILALDRAGCLQTARWSDVGPKYLRRMTSAGNAAAAPLPNPISSAHNNDSRFGAEASNWLVPNKRQV